MTAAQMRRKRHPGTSFGSCSSSARQCKAAASSATAQHQAANTTLPSVHKGTALQQDLQARGAKVDAAEVATFDGALHFTCMRFCHSSTPTCAASNRGCL